MLFLQGIEGREAGRTGEIEAEARRVAAARGENLKSFPPAYPLTNRKSSPARAWRRHY
jgi:hypothetical protein